MEKTAIQQMREWVLSHSGSINQNILLSKISEMLAIEKDAHKKTYIAGYGRGYNNDIGNFEQYYSQTYEK